MKILIFESNEIHPSAIKLLQKNGFHTQTELQSEGNKKEIEAIFIRSYTKVTPTMLEEFPNLKYILRAGVGLENIDTDATQKKGIKIINSPGSNANAVSELVICFMILLTRKIPDQINLLRKGQWRDKEKTGSELKNKTIGLIGCGAIGALVIQKLLNFGIKEILAFDPYLDEKTLKERNAKKATLDEILKKSDIITLHLPLTPQTHNLINIDKLSLTKKGAYIINTSRGGIINEKDLITALKNGQIGAAALDVFENEPEVNQDLLELPNAILTPHIGSFTHEADEEMSVLTVRNFLKIYEEKNK